MRLPARRTGLALLVGVAAVSLGGVRPVWARTGGAAHAAPPPAGWVVDRVRVEPAVSGVAVSVGGRSSYRGVLDIAPTAVPGGVDVVNDVGLEDYLRGLAEMPPTWPAAALQAQAIAARTYALHEIAGAPPGGPQICATDRCQVYTGLAREAEPGGAQWDAAVAATSGQILTYLGAPILAMYSSSNGGQTVDGGQPYLRSVPDPDDVIAPLHHWTVAVPLGDLTRVFATPGPVEAATTAYGSVVMRWTSAPSSPGGSPNAGSPNPGSPGSGSPGGPSPSTTAPSRPASSPSTTSSTAPAPLPAPSARAASGSPVPTSTTATSTTATSATPTSATPTSAPTSGAPTSQPPASRASDGQAGSGAVILAPPDFRAALNHGETPPDGMPLTVPSDRYSVSTSGADAVIDGGGWGHGIGMSQYGALGKALRGWRAADILAAYYGGLRPVAQTGLPATIRVDLGSQPTVTAGGSGPLRVTDGSGQVLAAAATGFWTIAPGPHAGQLRVTPPAGALAAPPTTAAPVGASIPPTVPVAAVAPAAMRARPSRSSQPVPVLVWPAAALFGAVALRVGAIARRAGSPRLRTRPAVQ